MVKSEELSINGKNFVKQYSDRGVYIHKIGTDEEYTEAIDVENAPYEYEETDKPIEKENLLEV